MVLAHAAIGGLLVGEASSIHGATIENIDDKDDAVLDNLHWAAGMLAGI